MNERWMLALALYAVGTFGLWMLRKQSPLSLPIIGVGVTMLIGTFYPLMSLYIEPRSWRNLANISEEALLSAQFEYLAFTAGLVGAITCVWIFRRGHLAAPKLAPEARAYTRFRDSFVAWGLVALGAMLYGAYINQVGLSTLISTEDFASKYLESRGMGVLLFGLNLMIVGVSWGEASDLGRRSRLCLRLIALAIFTWSFFFIAVRSYAVALTLGFMAVHCVKHGFQVRRIRLRMVALIFVAYFCVEGYAIVRSSWMSSGDLLRAVELAGSLDSNEALGGVVGGSEFSHPFITTAELMQYEEGGSLHGESYANALIAFVPLFLMPNRPATLAQDFVANYYPALDERGGGSSFSMVAEAWWNFGAILGCLLIGLASGALLMWSHVSARKNPHGISSRLLPYLAFLCVVYHRGQSQAIFKQVVSVLIPLLALVLLARLLWSVLRTSSTRRLPSTSHHPGAGHASRDHLPLGVH